MLELISGDVPGALEHVEYLRQQGRLEARIEHFRIHVLQSAEVRLWAAQPRGVIADVLLALTHRGAHDAGYSAAELLVLGMRAVADLAESARARHDRDAMSCAEDSARSLELEAAALHEPPFSGAGLWQVDGPAHGAGSVAERARFEGIRDATAWARTACKWEARAAGPQLTHRELHVLRLLAEGRTNVQIAQELFISASTVSVHVHRILRKLGAANRVEAATLAERARLLTLEETPDSA